MRAEEFAQRVPNARRGASGWWTGSCPGHEDKRASLAFKDGDRALIVKCHAGCTVEQIAGGLGLSLAELLHSNGQPPPRTQRGPVIRHPLRDIEGNIVAVHCRQYYSDGSKRAWWEQPDGTPGLGGRKVADLPLYGVHEIPDTGFVVVVEGEPARDALNASGISAVGTVTGAGGTPNDEVLRPLLGLPRVVLWPDHADGDAHMRRVGEALRRLGHGDVRWFAWQGATEEGDDAADYFERGGPAEQLQQLLEAAPRFESAATSAASAAIVVRLADVAPEPVEWLWPRRIAHSKLHFLIGDPGIGKSLVVLDVVARHSCGKDWPDGGTAPVGTTIVLSTEDGVADTIRPRVDVAGGDAGRVFVVKAIREGAEERHPSLKEDLDHIDHVIRETGADFLIIDPISAYMGETNTWRDSDVRRVLGPVAKLAEGTGAAIVGIMHVTKAADRRAIARGLGSIGFLAAARVALAAGRDKNNPARRLLACVKSNLGPEPPGLAYTVSGICPTCGTDVGERCRACDRDSVARIAWEPEAIAGLSADDVLGERTTTDRSPGQEAEEFLRKMLADGSQWANAIHRAAAANGISRGALFAGKSALGIRAHKDGRGRWYWGEEGKPPAKSTADAGDEKKSTGKEQTVPFQEPIGGKSESTGSSRKNTKSTVIPGNGTGPATEDGQAADEGLEEVAL